MKFSTLSSCTVTLTYDRAVNQEQGHPIEDIGISSWPVDVVEFGADAYAHRKQVDVKQLYKQVPQTAWVSWSSRQAEFSSSSSYSSSSSHSWGQNAGARQMAWVLRTPVERPSRMRKKCCNCQRNLGSISVSLSPSPTHLSHITNINPFATLSRIKSDRYIFLKKCVQSFIEPRYYVSFICM